MLGKSSRAKNQLDSFSRFDRTPTCGRQINTDTDRQTDRHKAMASTRASIASRG